MWTAELIHKEARTDGAMDLIVVFSNGRRKYQKTFVVSGDFDLPEMVRREIENQTKLETKSTVALGPITPKVIAVTPKNNTVEAISALQKIKRAVDLGLLDSSELTEQQDIVKSDPEFLKYI